MKGKNLKEDKVVISQKDITEGKNSTGESGYKCNNCGGYGYTMKLGGGRLDCMDCNNSGIRELSHDELQKEVYELRRDIYNFRSALLKDLGFHNMKVPSGIGKDKS